MPSDVEFLTAAGRGAGAAPDEVLEAGAARQLPRWLVHLGIAVAGGAALMATLLASSAPEPPPVAHRTTFYEQTSRPLHGNVLI